MSHHISIKLCRCEFGGYDLCHYCAGSGVIIEDEKKPEAIKQKKLPNLNTEEAIFHRRKKIDYDCFAIAQNSILENMLKHFNFFVERIDDWKKYKSNCKKNLIPEVEKHSEYIIKRLRMLQNDIEERIAIWNRNHPYDKLFLNRKEN